MHGVRLLEIGSGAEDDLQECRELFWKKCLGLALVRRRELARQPNARPVGLDVRYA